MCLHVNLDIISMLFSACSLVKRHVSNVSRLVTLDISVRPSHAKYISFGGKGQEVMSRCGHQYAPHTI